MAHEVAGYVGLAQERHQKRDPGPVVEAEIGGRGCWRAAQADEERRDPERGHAREREYHEAGEKGQHRGGGEERASQQDRHEARDDGAHLARLPVAQAVVVGRARLCHAGQGRGMLGKDRFGDLVLVAHRHAHRAEHLFEDRTVGFEPLRAGGGDDGEGAVPGEGDKSQPQADVGFQERRQGRVADRGEIARAPDALLQRQPAGERVFRDHMLGQKDDAQGLWAGCALQDQGAVEVGGQERPGADKDFADRASGPWGACIEKSQIPRCGRRLCGTPLL